VRDGKLRQDLYFRLKTFEIEIPPLRDRREDIPKLVDTFLRRFATQLGREIPQLAPECLEVLRNYPWPGNVRELQNAIEHSLVLCDGPILTARCLPREVQMPELAAVPGSASAPQTLEEVEKQALVDALRRANGNKKRAAEILGIHRPTLYAKLRRFGLIDRAASPAPNSTEPTAY
jgi:DNA-binding NtrC family response regulator